MGKGLPKTGAPNLEHQPGVAGIDEAGRGPLAGPVVAACVMLPPEFDCQGLNDSKQLDRGIREAFAHRIRAEALWGLAVVDHDEIDRINILQATFIAMSKAYRDLKASPLKILVDGNLLPPGLKGKAEAVVKGDGKHASIAAASVLAKVERDRIMSAYGKMYPDYGFERHFGYSTPEHLEALGRHGPCPIHRMSFHPLRPDDQLALALDD